MVLVGGARRVGASVLMARREPEPSPLRLSTFHAPEIVFGHDSLAEAAHAAVRLGARRPFVVSDPGVVRRAGPPNCSPGCARRGWRRTCGPT